MHEDDCLKIAGEAADLLGSMGVQACARLREGKVTLQAWRGRRMLECEVDDPSISPRHLAGACAAELRVVARTAATLH